TLKQNLQILRLATALNLNIFWNLLWGFPGEKIEEYEKIVDLLPLISHLEPPESLVHFRIVKFSPYFKNHDDYGISNVKPLSSYRKVFPSHIDFKKIAYYFSGDYHSECYEHPHVIRQLDKDLKNWFRRWDSPLSRPRLHLFRDEEKGFRIIDTRELDNCEMTYEISEKRARSILCSGPYGQTDNQVWALENKMAIISSNDYVPLITTDPEIIESLGLG
ncbi:MAG: hypothetical protein JEY91_19210, partial [Spirochaetaceae bacterium]|nr:hypothetical protein [Spirochaetaceae bacterium]